MFTTTSREKSRMDLRTLSALCFIFSLATSAAANVHYEAQLQPIAEGIPDWRGGSFTGQFRNSQVACSEDMPFFTNVSHQLDEELTSITLRLDDRNGTVIFRIAPDDSQLTFTSAECELLTTWSDPKPWKQGAATRFYVVFETESYPEGALGATLEAWLFSPTISQSWGEVKSRYRASR